MAIGLMRCFRGHTSETYNLASGKETTIAELAHLINEATGNPVPPNFPARDWDRSGKRFGSTKKAKADLGFSAEVDIAEGIGRLVEWTKINREFIKSCMDRHSPFWLSENMSERGRFCFAPKFL